MEYLPAVLSSLLAHLPIYIAWCVGIVLALLRWSKNPRFALAVVLSLGGMMVFSLVGTALSVTLPMVLYRESGSHAKVGYILGAVGLVNSVLQACCWAGLLTALFALRDPK